MSIKLVAELKPSTYDNSAELLQEGIDKGLTSVMIIGMTPQGNWELSHSYINDRYRVVGLLQEMIQDLLGR
jgi:hypothetical protein